MTLYEFNMLSPAEREDHLSNSAELICELHDDHASSFFFALGEFFIEAVLKNGDASASEAIAFVTGERFERMIQGIDLKLS